MRLSINHNTRNDPKNEITMEELIKNRDKEFNNFKMNNNSQNFLSSKIDTQKFLSSKLDFDKILKQKEEQYKNINNTDFNLEPKNKTTKFFLEFNNEEIEINENGQLECDPPIMLFKNKFGKECLSINYDTMFKENTDILSTPLILKIKVNDKEFKYKFDKARNFYSRTKYDERFKDFIQSSDTFNFRNETEFIKFTISDGLYKDMFTDDNFRFLLFAKYSNKIIFRQGNFRMIRDNFYNELYGK